MQMLKALIPIELNLGSNIALRYACQKAKLLDIGLQPIHVEEPDDKSHSANSGWIRRTWESGLEDAGRAEVQRILDGEKLDCLIVPHPIVSVGDREEEILRELQRVRYDIFVEGMVSNFNPTVFRNLLRSKLYKRMPCPALIVKNLITSNSVLLLADARVEPAWLANQFQRMFPKSKVEFDLALYAADARQRGVDPQELLESIVRLLEAKGAVPNQTLVLEERPEDSGEELGRYGLVAAVVDRRSSRKSPLMEALARTPSPLLLFWQS
jgi:hypothetical protein